MIVTLLAFSRKRTRSRSWFSRIRLVSRDFLAARLFFLDRYYWTMFTLDVFTHRLLSQYLSSLAPAPEAGDGRQLTDMDRGIDREGTVIKLWQYWPMRGQHPGHVTCIDQWEAHLVGVASVGGVWPALAGAGLSAVLRLPAEAELLVRGAVVGDLNRLHLLLDLWLTNGQMIVVIISINCSHLMWPDTAFLWALGLPALLLGEDVVYVDGVSLVDQHGDDAADVPGPGLPHPVVCPRPRVLNNSSTLRTFTDGKLGFRCLLRNCKTVCLIACRAYYWRSNFRNLKVKTFIIRRRAFLFLLFNVSLQRAVSMWDDGAVLCCVTCACAGKMMPSWAGPPCTP